MLESKIKTIIEQGEGLRVEFKECKNALNKDVYETVCAFLNRSGGELLLGVNDKGAIIGINSEYVQKIKNDFTTSINNIQKISPSFYLSLDEIHIEGKIILYIYIPESSQVHRCNGKIYDRNENGDFNITDNNHLIAALFLRKQTSYSENRIYPYAHINDFREDLIARVRRTVSIQTPNHPWATLDDFQLLKSAQLYMRDYQTGKEGFTLGGILLFGKDEIIFSVLPHMRTDAIVRKIDLDRYDDRDDIRTNLIESYDRLMAFTIKHLPDKFFLERDRRISIRDHIFREFIGNILIHREYMNSFPAKLIIEKDRVYTENSNNKYHTHGVINPMDFSPRPKNPSIAKVFKAIGLADELGSGVRKLFKYCKAYGGTDPRLLDEDLFKMIIPLTQATPQATPQAIREIQRTKKILAFCKTPKTSGEIQQFLKLKNRKHFRTDILNPLLEKGALHPTIPDKLTSPKQKYYSENT